MQFLLFSKKSVVPSRPSLVEFEPGQNKQITEFCSQYGTLCLISPATFDSIQNFIVKAGFIDCHEKGKKIDLYRALRFDEKRERDHPRYLLFDTDNKGAFKRGFDAFYTRHFNHHDPPCLIIIQEEILEALIRDENKKTNSPPKKANAAKDDSLFLLIDVPESNDIIKKLEEVYIGDSIQAKHTRALIYRAAQTDSPVLILGESGTGKDVIAHQIYTNSLKYTKGFFRVNCSALPETLLESELFGYLKGSFTGAGANKKGLFPVAGGGTIFLDEIGDLSLANQAKILHAVEKQGIRLIGASNNTPVDIRIIAATNRNLDAMMMSQTFRDDLYYRISTFRITSSPLREHPEDIPLLAQAYWKRKPHDGILSPTFLNYLKSYHWPGNVRELYSLLNSLRDYFGDISPTADHVDAIRKSRQEVLSESKILNQDDPTQLLNIRSKNILINVQNILRSIKIGMRPIINRQAGEITAMHDLKNLKQFIGQQVDTLNELCLEPTYFKSWVLFKEITRYRYVLDKAFKSWPDSTEQLRDIWISDLQQLDDDINKGILEIIWGKIDM